MTLQLGGDARLACVRGLEDDRAWFARHHGRAHRVRQPMGGEGRLQPRPPRGFRPMIVVRQLRPGARVRLGFAWRGAPPLNSEAIAAEIFAAAASTRPNIAEIERLLDGGAP